MSQPLDGRQLDDALGALVGWEVLGGGTTADPHVIERVLDLDSFTQCIALVNLVAEVSEELGHHPDIAIAQTMVGLQITDHDAGGITETCLTLAARIDDLVEG